MRDIRAMSKQELDEMNERAKKARKATIEKVIRVHAEALKQLADR
jgi:hypothetical protein